MAATMRTESAGLRIGRFAFWLSLLFVGSSAFALSTFVARNLARAALPFGLHPAHMHALIWLAALGLVALASARRLNDRGRSRLWLAPLVGGPVLSEALSFALEAMGSGLAATVAGFMSLVLTVWALIELGFVPGATAVARHAPISDPPRHVAERDPPSGKQEGSTERTGSPVGGGGRRRSAAARRRDDAPATG